MIYVTSAARRSILPLRADQLQLCQRPINRALGFRHRLSFGRGLASEKDPLKGERPCPKLTFDALNDGVFDVSIFQLQSSTRSRRTASLTGFFGFSHVLDDRGPIQKRRVERRSVPSSTAKEKKGLGSTSLSICNMIFVQFVSDFSCLFFR